MVELEERYLAVAAPGFLLGGAHERLVSSAETLAYPSKMFAVATNT